MPGFDFKYFFDRPGIADAVDKYERKVLVKTGAYSRSVMRNGMKKIGKKGQASSPGEFPKARRGDIRRLTFFSYDAQAKSVVVGPEKFPTAARGVTLEGAETVPQLLQQGGTVSGTRERRKRRLTAEARRRIEAARQQGKAFKKRGKGRIIGRYRSQIAPRPFVTLTNQKAAPKLAEIAAQERIGK